MQVMTSDDNNVVTPIGMVQLMVMNNQISLCDGYWYGYIRHQQVVVNQD